MECTLRRVTDEKIASDFTPLPKYRIHGFRRDWKLQLIYSYYTLYFTLLRNGLFRLIYCTVRYASNAPCEPLVSIKDHDWGSTLLYAGNNQTWNKPLTTLGRFVTVIRQDLWGEYNFLFFHLFDAIASFLLLQSLSYGMVDLLVLTHFFGGEATSRLLRMKMLTSHAELLSLFCRLSLDAFSLKTPLM